MGYVLTQINIDVVISGTANGPDKWGELLAKTLNISCERYPANWDKYKKRAGFLRNVEMSKHADYVIIFHDGESRGSVHMKNIALDKKIPTWIARRDFSDYVYYPSGHNSMQFITDEVLAYELSTNKNRR